MSKLEDKERLIASLKVLAETIEKCPPEIIGSEVNVYSSPDAVSATGIDISVSAGPGSSGKTVGQKVAVTIGPGQSGAGVRINMHSGGPPPNTDVQAPKSSEEIIDIVKQIRDAVTLLESSNAPESWIMGLLNTVKRWRSAALTAAISGSVNAATKYYLGG